MARRHQGVGSVSEETERLDELLASLPPMRVRMWSCWIRAHADRKAVTVEWIDDVAHCTAPGCELTSTETDRMLKVHEEVLRERIAKDIEAERDNGARGWNDSSPKPDSFAEGLFTGIKEGLTAAAKTTREGPLMKNGVRI